MGCCWDGLGRAEWVARHFILLHSIFRNETTIKSKNRSAGALDQSERSVSKVPISIGEDNN